MDSVVIDGSVTALHVFVMKAADASTDDQPVSIPQTAIEGNEIGVIDFYVGEKWHEHGRWIGQAYVPPSVARSIATQLHAQQALFAERRA
ncbi:MAG TPA: hypothetical protein VNN21_01265 [Dehalococcoidia bacterium]|nr:hypothetical protein [Dehalococcoidia bacterium]